MLLHLFGSIPKNNENSKKKTNKLESCTDTEILTRAENTKTSSYLPHGEIIMIADYLTVRKRTQHFYIFML